MPGTRLVRDTAVKNRLSYRSVTIAIGICVALIVVFTLWARKGPALALGARVSTVLSLAEIPDFHELVRKASRVEF